MAFFNKLNPTPGFPDHTGPYKVGSIDVEIAASDLQPSSATFVPSSTVAFRCFYPCHDAPPKAAPVYWVQQPQRTTVSAYVKFLGVGSAMADVLSYFPQLLYHIRLPVFRNAPLLDPPTSSHKWPVIVFSHGLGGSRNAYSHLCGSLASFGFVVLAPEHRDGSSIISHIRATATSKARTVHYHRFPHQPSPAVYAGRDDMLRTRLWEVSLIHEALQKMNAGEHITNLDSKVDKKDSTSPSQVLADFNGRLDIDTPGSLIFAGHSFGSATTVQLIKSLFYHPSNPHFARARPDSHVETSPLLSFTPSASLLSQITQSTPTILLDLWALPLASPATSALRALPMPHFTQPHDATTPTHSPILAILSSAFAAWSSNFSDVMSVLSRPDTPSALGIPPAQIFYPLSSAHLSQSDFGILYPRVTRYLAKAPEPARTLELNVRAILQALRDVGVEAAGADDPEILSARKGAVKGWVAVPVPGAAAVPAADGASLASESSDSGSELSLVLDEKSALDGFLTETAVVGDAELEAVVAQR